MQIILDLIECVYDVANDLEALLAQRSKLSINDGGESVEDEVIDAFYGQKLSNRLVFRSEHLSLETQSKFGTCGLMDTISELLVGCWVAFISCASRISGSVVVCGVLKSSSRHYKPCSMEWSLYHPEVHRYSLLSNRNI